MPASLGSLGVQALERPPDERPNDPDGPPDEELTFEEPADEEQPEPRTAHPYINSSGF